MTSRNPWQSYRQVATKTAGPGQLVQMLLEGAIGFLDRALVGFQHEDPLEFNRTINNNILRAQAIVNELNITLNMAEGGEIALHLRRLYTYMDRRLQESNQVKQREGIDDVIERLRVLRDTWAQMLQQGVEKPESDNQMVA
jgi:flagellar protein FliS